LNTPPASRWEKEKKAVFVVRLGQKRTANNHHCRAHGRDAWQRALHFFTSPPLSRPNRPHLTKKTRASLCLCISPHAPVGRARPHLLQRRRARRPPTPALSVRNMVPTLTSRKRRGLSLNGRC
jgi:hypothetical protein